jgi:hypothetical protein
VVIGLGGLIEPRALGVGYDVIEQRDGIDSWPANRCGEGVDELMVSRELAGRASA